MAPPTGTQTEQGNLSQKRCDLKNVGFGGVPYIYTNVFIVPRLFVISSFASTPRRPHKWIQSNRSHESSAARLWHFGGNYEVSNQQIWGINGVYIGYKWL